MKRRPSEDQEIQLGRVVAIRSGYGQEQPLKHTKYAPQSCRSSPCKGLQVERRVDFQDDEWDG